MPKTEEQKEEKKEPQVYENLDQAFGEFVEEPADEEIKEKSDEEQLREKENAEPAVREDEKEEQQQQTKTTETEEEKEEEEEERDQQLQIDWTAVGLPEYEGLAPEQVATIRKQEKIEIDYRNKQYGRQAQELGELRKAITQIQQEQKITKQPSVVDDKKTKENKPFDVDEYLLMHEQDPLGAFKKYIGPVVDEMINVQLQKGAESGPIAEIIQKKEDSAAFERFLAEHDDAPQFLPAMQTLDAPENLGEQARPYEELYQLSKLASEDNELYGKTYLMLQKYPTMPLTDALHFCGGETAAQGKKTTPTEPTSRDTIKKEVRKMQTIATKRSHSVSAKSPVIHDSIDEAFDSVVD